MINTNEINKIITFSYEVIDSADTIKAVKKHKLAAKCSMAKIEMIEAQEIFNEKLNEFFCLSTELNSMEE